MPLPINKGDEVRALVNIQLPGKTTVFTPGFILWVRDILPDGRLLVERDGARFPVTAAQVEQAHHVVNGTHYSTRTPAPVIQVLELARLNRSRIRVHLGDTNTGRDWLEEWDVTGVIGRSMGPIKIPLMIASSRSFGGPGLLDDCIVKITDSRSPRRILYQHPAYHFGQVTLCPVRRGDTIGRPRRSLFAMGYRVAINVDGQNHANFKRRAQADRWLRNMNLTASEVL